ncbi:MAG: hypothetical protein H0W71_03780 [Sphingomonas sp.]|nr:hypothetical protein [Sphingomonas sp.]
MRRILLVAAALALLVVLMTVLRTLVAPRDGATELSSADMNSARAEFAALLNGELPGAEPLANRMGLIVRQVEQPFRGTIIEERPGNAHGQGAYFIRNAAQRPYPMLVTAPHRGAERYTGPLAAAVFAETDASAAAWNSAPRGRAGNSSGLDLARLERHLFTAFATAFAEVHPNGRIIQLHGFNPAKRQTESGRRADVILSSGSERPSLLIQSIGACLSDSLPSYDVRVFPTEVSELGALNNAQARALHKLSHDVFVHVELSLRLRAALIDSSELRSAFGECLQA